MVPPTNCLADASDTDMAILREMLACRTINGVHLKNTYSDIAGVMPEPRRLLEPRRYVVNGPLAEVYQPAYTGFLSDFGSTVEAAKSLRYAQVEPATVGALQTTPWELGQISLQNDKVPKEERRPTMNPEIAKLYLLHQKLWAGCGAPTYYLAPDIAEALLNTEPRRDFHISEIKWPYPAIRVFLPTDLLVLARMVNVPFLDIALFEPGVSYQSNDAIVDRFLISEKGTPVRVSASYDKPFISVSVPYTVYGSARYGFQLPLSQTWGEFAESLPDSSDTVEGLSRIGDLAINIVMLMGWAPDEIGGESILRKAKTNGKGEIIRTELWSPRFIGRPVLKQPRPANPNPVSNGLTHFEEVRKAHWKRQVYGPGGSLRKLIWVGLYRTRSREERGMAPEN